MKFYIYCVFLLFLVLCPAAKKANYCEIACPKVQQTCSVHCNNMTAECLCEESAARCSCVDGLVGCSAAGQPCQTDNDCCFSCTGVVCAYGTCQPNFCVGTGTPCNWDCACCSQQCNIDTLDPGTCS